MAAVVRMAGRGGARMFLRRRAAAWRRATGAPALRRGSTAGRCQGRRLEDEVMTFEIVVPPNAPPGHPLVWRLPNGMAHSAVVPVGAAPGSRVHFTVRMTSEGPIEHRRLASATRSC